MENGGVLKMASEPPVVPRIINIIIIYKKNFIFIKQKLFLFGGQGEQKCSLCDEFSTVGTL